MEKLRNVFNSLCGAFNSRYNVLFGLSTAFLFGMLLLLPGIIFNTTQNLNTVHGVFEILITIILSILFGINVVFILEHFKFIGSVKKTTIGTTSLASMIGVLFSGCATCGLSFASSVGLGSFVSILPWGGVEIKIISVLLLIYSIFRLSQPITCALPRYVSRA